MIRNLNTNLPEDQAVLAAFATLSFSHEWKSVIKPYLDEELHKLDVANRTAEPYMATRLGAAAETLQAIIDKFDRAVDIIGNMK